LGLAHGHAAGLYQQTQQDANDQERGQPVILHRASS
jgi:hypothetical protein